MIRKIFVGLFALTCILPAAGGASASQVASAWYFGNWDCNIDGRPARMRWRVVDDPQTVCSGGVCSSSSGVKVVGRFSDNGSQWVPLKVRFARGNDLGIRYMGAEQDNWSLRYYPSSRIAKGSTTWRGQNYPLSCRK